MRKIKKKRIGKLVKARRIANRILDFPGTFNWDNIRDPGQYSYANDRIQKTRAELAVKLANAVKEI